jgi:hypothetical protein
MGRCTARPDNLDGPSMLRRREHTDTLVEMFELGVLWDDYGIVGDIVVSLFLIRILLRTEDWYRWPTGVQPTILLFVWLF